GGRPSKAGSIIRWRSRAGFAPLGRPPKGARCPAKPRSEARGGGTAQRGAEARGVGARRALAKEEWTRCLITLGCTIRGEPTKKSTSLALALEPSRVIRTSVLGAMCNRARGDVQQCARAAG